MTAVHESDLARIELDDDGEPQQVWPRITTTHPIGDFL